jgi:hypothetical protein
VRHEIFQALFYIWIKRWWWDMFRVKVVFHLNSILGRYFWFSKTSVEYYYSCSTVWRAISTDVWYKRSNMLRLYYTAIGYYYGCFLGSGWCMYRSVVIYCGCMIHPKVITTAVLWLCTDWQKSVSIQPPKNTTHVWNIRRIFRRM